MAVNLWSCDGAEGRKGKKKTEESARVRNGCGMLERVRVDGIHGSHENPRHRGFDQFFMNETDEAGDSGHQ